MSKVREILKNFELAIVANYTNFCEGHPVKISKPKAIALSELKSLEPSVEEIIKTIEELGLTQFKAIIRTVDKKGLMNTGWGDIDEEGGKLDFAVIAQAIHELIMSKYGGTNEENS